MTRHTNVAITDQPDAFPEGSLERRLGRFNAKERFALIQRVMGVNFVPHADFLDEVLKKCDVQATPDRVFCAMDFHLDWLYAALMNPSMDEAPRPLTPDEHGNVPVTGTSEDADFLICFSEEQGPGSITHLLLFEAKGVGEFGSTQMLQKLKHYRAMKHAFDANPDIKPVLFLVSPNDPLVKDTKQSEPLRAILAEFESIFPVHHIGMRMPEQLRMVTRLRDGEGQPFTAWKLRPYKA
ncbi:hypothetical protein SAMN05414139_10865 [Burkholderia sp. D7]|nr:hypothetical protein SAMN05414139_10865 [Burkholderia sp. D7]